MKQLTQHSLCQGMFQHALTLPVGAAKVSYRIVIKPEIVWPVPGLGIFKHNPIAVVGLAADHSHAVVILRVHV